MKKNNETLWVNVEGLAINYANESDFMKKEEILANVFDVMKKYIETCVNNAVRNAYNYGLVIPEEDFESRFMQSLWEALDAYKADGETNFKNIVLRRFRFAEAHTWRQYKAKGTSEDKDGVSYNAARWDSLDRTVQGTRSDDDKTIGDLIGGEAQSAEEEYLDRNEEDEILKDFAKINERYSKVIRFMYMGYDGDALAVVTGEAESNNAKMRKLIQRSKEAFAKFMTDRMAMTR